MQKHSPSPLKPWILLAASLLSCLFALLARLCFQFKMQVKSFSRDRSATEIFWIPKVDLSWRHHKWNIFAIFYMESEEAGAAKKARAPWGLAPAPHGRNGRGSSWGARAFSRLWGCMPPRPMKAASCRDKGRTQGQGSRAATGPPILGRAQGWRTVPVKLHHSSNRRCGFAPRPPCDPACGSEIQSLLAESHKPASLNHSSHRCTGTYSQTKHIHSQPSVFYILSTTGKKIVARGTCWPSGRAAISSRPCIRTNGAVQLAIGVDRRRVPWNCPKHGNTGG